MLFLCSLENVIPDRISRRKSESAFFNISQELGMDEIFFFKKVDLGRYQHCSSASDRPS